jgi:hypothetical protein
MGYRETIVGTLSPRTNLSHSITLGLSVLFDFSSSEPSAASN